MYFSEDVYNWVSNPDTWLSSTLSAGSQWSRDVSGTNFGLLWQHGYSYQVNSQARDEVQVPGPNWEVNLGTATYYYDTTPPVTIINMPPDQSWQKQLPNITGGITDPQEDPAKSAGGAVPSGPKNVEITIQRMSDTLYWDGSDFTKFTSSWNAATMFQSSWTYAFPNSYWTNATSYTVVSRGYDNTNNMAWGTTSYFIFDTTQPVSSLALPAGAYGIYPTASTMPLFSGTASDVSPGQVDHVEVEIKHIADSTFWDGHQWLGDTWLQGASYNPGTGIWTYSTSGVTWVPDPLNLGQKYEVKARAVDKANNIQPTPEGSQKTFTLVPPRPISTV